MSTPPYNFPDPKNTPCFVCSHVLNGEIPILHISHDHTDGAWQFLCAKSKHDLSTARIICLGDVVKMDISVNDVANTSVGYGAKRKSEKHKWKYYEDMD